MTNEITIDGVNVAECKFFKQSGLADKCYLYVDEYGGSDCFCENNKNCYYKQLQRLKQENEKLKLEKRKESRCPHYCLGECSLTDGGNENGNCIGFRNCFEKLEQENEELKERNLVIESRADEVITEYEKLRLHVESLKSQNENLYTERTQLKQKNEELEKENNYLKEYRKHSSTCQECYEDGYNDGLVYNKTLKQYQHALKDIKEIAENAVHYRYATKSDDYSEGMRQIGHYVLAKLKEVLNEE